jgi:SAM-dependent methyltransferase
MIIDDSHFAYLSLQRGAIADLAGDRAAWCAAYAQSLQDDLASMAPHLPARCRTLLDVGSGLGGIDALLNRHYRGTVHVRLLDGLDDPAEVRLHRETYNSMAVAADFLGKNGVDYLGCYSPKWARAPYDGATFELIVSLQSWCFHFGPEAYLDFVKRRCRPGTVLILDVRADKPLWRMQIGDAFTEVACARAARKYNRLVFHAA